MDTSTFYFNISVVGARSFRSGAKGNRNALVIDGRRPAGVHKHATTTSNNGNYWTFQGYALRVALTATTNELSGGSAETLKWRLRKEKVTSKCPTFENVWLVFSGFREHRYTLSILEFTRSTLGVSGAYKYIFGTHKASYDKFTYKIVNTKTLTSFVSRVMTKRSVIKQHVADLNLKG